MTARAECDSLAQLTLASFKEDVRSRGRRGRLKSKDPRPLRWRRSSKELVSDDFPVCVNQTAQPQERPCPLADYC